MQGWKDAKERLRKIEDENKALRDKVRELEMRALKAERDAKEETESETSEMAGVAKESLKTWMDPEVLATKGRGAMAREVELMMAENFQVPNDITQDKVDEARTEAQACMGMMMTYDNMPENEKASWAEMINLSLIEEEAKLKRQRVI